MRIAELSQRTEIPVATIKYYLREGLLPPGTTTAPNQAQYDEHHVARLRLIRALREGAGLSIATLGRVFAAMEAHQPEDRPAYLTVAVRALSEPLDVPERKAADYDEARREVDALLDDLGWDTDSDSPGHDDLVRALVSLHRFAPAAITDPRQLRPYADAVRSLATTEIPTTLDTDIDTDETLRFSVLGTVLFEPVLLALRKLAHVDRIREVGRDRPPPVEDARSISPEAPTAPLTTSTAPSAEDARRATSNSVAVQERPTPDEIHSTTSLSSRASALRSHTIPDSPPS